MFFTSDGGAEIEEVMRVGDGSANYLLLYRFARTPANRDATRRDGATRDETRRPSCVIFHGTIDDNAIRGSGGRCRRNFSSVKKIPSWRISCANFGIP